MRKFAAAFSRPYLVLILGLSSGFTFFQETNAQTSGSVTLREQHFDRSGNVAYTETRTFRAGEPVVGAAGRAFSQSEIELLRSRSGRVADDTGEDPWAADGVVIELNDPPAVKVYNQQVRMNVGEGGGYAVSTSAAEEAARHAEKIAAKQAVVLRAAGLDSAAVQGVSAGAADIRQFSKVFNGVAAHGVEVAKISEALKRDPIALSYVKRVVPNLRVQTALDGSAAQIKASDVWAYPGPTGALLDGTGMRIGIVDTGVDYTHADLGGCFGAGCKVAGGWDFVNNDADPIDDHGHGTHVAATAAGNGSYLDGSGVARPLFGVAPGAQIYAYKVLSSGGFGSTADVIAGVERCADPNDDGDFSDHLDVCNLSLGGSGNPDDIMSAAVDAAVDAGVVMAIAAGNSGPSGNTIGSPGTARKAVTVAAACKPGANSGYCASGKIAQFSSRGPIAGFPDVIKPDVAAPGVDICAAEHGEYASSKRCLDGRHIAISGTSMATPHVAGAAALIRQAHPELSPQQVKDALMAGAVDLEADRTAQGSGLIDVLQSIALFGLPNSVGRVAGTPVRLEVVPRTAVTEVPWTLRVTNTTNGALEYIPSFSTAVAGFSAVFAPDRVVIAPGAAAEVQATFSVNLDLVPSGNTLAGTIIFGTALGDVRIGVGGTVKDRLIVSAPELDFGVSKGDLDSWSEQRTIRFTNTRTDITSSFDVTLTCCGMSGASASPGITASAGTSTVVVPADGSVELPITVQTSDASLSNGRYSGELRLSSPLETLTVPITFFKGYGLRFQYGGGEPPFWVLVYNEERTKLVLPEYGAAETLALLTSPGPWHAQGAWWDDVVMERIVVKKDIATNAAITDVSMANAEATKMLRVVAVDPDGQPEPSGMITFQLNHRRFGPQMWTMTTAMGAAILSNDLSPDISFTAVGAAPRDANVNVYQYYYLGAGDENVVLRNGPFTPKYISAPMNRVTGESVGVYASLCNTIYSTEPFGVIMVGCWSSSAGAALTPGQVGTLNASTNVEIDPAGLGYPEAPEWRLETGAPDENVFDRYVETPSFYISPGRTTAWVNSLAGRQYSSTASSYVSDRLVELGSDAHIALGAAPLRDSGQWYNYADREAGFLSQKGYFGTLHRFSGQSGESYWSENSEIYTTYVLARDGAPVASGVLETYAVTGQPEIRIPAPLGLIPPGRYQLSVSRLVSLAGTQTQVASESTFTVAPLSTHLASPVDENPPALTSLTLTANGLIQNSIDPVAENILGFSLDPMPGLLAPLSYESGARYSLMEDSLRTVTLEYGADGVIWNGLPLSEVRSGVFSARIPAEGAATLHYFRISASDAAGNAFRYEFQMPSGVSAVIPGPTPTPTPFRWPPPPGYPSMPTPTPYVYDPSSPWPPGWPSPTPTPVNGDTLYVRVVFPDGMAFKRGKNAALTARVRHTARVERVVFQFDGKELCTKTRAPYVCRFRPTTSGRIVLRVFAMDDAGNQDEALYLLTVRRPAPGRKLRSRTK